MICSISHLLHFFLQFSPTSEAMLCGKPLHHDDTRGTLKFHLGRFSNNFENLRHMYHLYMYSILLFLWLALFYSHGSKPNIYSVYLDINGALSIPQSFRSGIIALTASKRSIISCLKSPLKSS